MQSAVTLSRIRNSSINALVATIALVVALAVGAIGGYLLKSQLAPVATATSTQAVTGGKGQPLAPAHDMPESDAAAGDFATSVARHAADERVEGDGYAPASQAVPLSQPPSTY